ncbi:MAG: hypothetical protein MI747_17725, partial [Desulfobacterales bacterium]|nr:hypothetical protein [Desulfobacterales bacterium]
MEELKPFLYIAECEGKEKNTNSEMLIKESMNFDSTITEGASIAGAALVGAAVLGGVFGAIKTVDTDNKPSNPPHEKKFSDDIVKTLAKASGLMVKTFDDAKNLDCLFPPGHPLPGKIYRLHPLAELANSNKSNVYIPEETYDDVLYAEREAELIKLLVALGATRISIRKAGMGYQQESKITSDSSSADASVASIKRERKNQSYTSLGQYTCDARTFTLEGLEWKKSDRLDLSPFGWLLYEPSWGAMVNAREVGGCLQASIELKKQ